MEDLISKCLEASGGNSSRICSSILETTVSSNSDYWGLFQPYSHLSSCRTTNGLDMPRALLDYAKEARGHPASQGQFVPQPYIFLDLRMGFHQKKISQKVSDIPKAEQFAKLQCF